MKSRKKTKYILLDFYIKADQRFDLVMIKPKLIKRLRLKMRPTSIRANHRLGISVINGNSIELKSGLNSGLKFLEYSKRCEHLLYPRKTSISAFY